MKNGAFWNDAYDDHFRLLKPNLGRIGILGRVIARE